MNAGPPRRGGYSSTAGRGSTRTLRGGLTGRPSFGAVPRGRGGRMASPKPLALRGGLGGAAVPKAGRVVQATWRPLPPLARGGSTSASSRSTTGPPASPAYAWYAGNHGDLLPKALPITPRSPPRPTPQLVDLTAPEEPCIPRRLPMASRRKQHFAEASTPLHSGPGPPLPPGRPLCLSVDRSTTEVRATERELEPLPEPRPLPSKPHPKHGRPKDPAVRMSERMRALQEKLRASSTVAAKATTSSSNSSSSGRAGRACHPRGSKRPRGDREPMAEENLPTSSINEEAPAGDMVVSSDESPERSLTPLSPSQRSSLSGLLLAFINRELTSAARSRMYICP